MTWTIAAVCAVAGIAYFERAILRLVASGFVLVVAAYDHLNPDWHPSVQIDIRNETGEEIDVDLTMLRLFTYSVTSPSELSIVRLAPGQRLGSVSLLPLVKLRRSAPRVDLAYAHVSLGRRVGRELSVEPPIEYRCRYDITLADDRATVNGCLPYIHF